MQVPVCHLQQFGALALRLLTRGTAVRIEHVAPTPATG
jgi:hypothetical protein